MSRSTLMLAGAAAVLLLLALLFANPFRDAVREPVAAPEALVDPGAVARADGVEFVVVGQPPVVLARVGSEWTVASEGGFAADTAAVGSVLRAVAGARSAGVASVNPDNRGKFEVDTTGVRVRVTRDGARVAGFTVGKPGPDFTTSYVRFEGSDVVHVVRGINRNMFTRPLGFRDRTLMRFEPEEVEAVVLERADGGWTLTRTDSVWVVSREGEPGRPAAEPKVIETVRNLSALVADGIVDRPDAVDTGLAAAELTITVRLVGGGERVLRVGAANDANQRYAARPDRDAVYLLSQWRVDVFAKPYEDYPAGEAAAN